MLLKMDAQKGESEVKFQEIVVSTLLNIKDSIKERDHDTAIDIINWG